MKMTPKKFMAMIASGRGMGVGDDYRPWEEITRKRSSPFSNLNLIPVPHLTRLAHYLSRGEREFALLLWWLGAEDVREQYPLWPWPHPQPVRAISEHTGEPDYHPGMAVVAADAGIRLGCYPGMGIPAVLTLDLLATIPEKLCSSQLVGFSCKPLSLYLKAGPGERLRERLELDRRYCLAANIQHHLVHPEQLSKTLVVQLHWLAPIEPIDKLRLLVNSEAYKDYLATMRKYAYVEPVYGASGRASHRVGWSVEEEHRALKIALWYQHLDANLSLPIHTTRPLCHGGVQIKKDFQNHWFGDQP